LEEYMAVDSNPDTGVGPELAAGVTEVVAVVSDNAALEDAINRLTLAGFDRADLSLPVTEPSTDQATPETSATPVDTDTDRRHARTLGTSMAAAAAANALGQGTEGIVQANREMAGQAGELRFGVRVASSERRAAAESAMRAAGGQQIIVRQR
jgi:hypothetical protein